MPVIHVSHGGNVGYMYCWGVGVWWEGDYTGTVVVYCKVRLGLAYKTLGRRRGPPVRGAGYEPVTGNGWQSQEISRTEAP